MPRFPLTLSQWLVRMHKPDADIVLQVDRAPSGPPPVQHHLRRHLLVQCVCALTLVTTTDAGIASAHAGTVVIISAKAPAINLSRNEIVDIFLGKSKQFPDGRNATPIDQLPSSDARNAFYEGLSGKSPSLMTAYWSKLIFTGEGQPPREVSSADTVRRLIAADPSLIGYIDSSMVDSSVKVIAVVP